MLWLVGRWLVMLMATLMAGAGTSACRSSGPMVVEGSVGTADRPLDADATRETRPQPYLLIRLSERRLYLLDDAPGTPDESFPIAVGREGLETPVGLFQVEEMLENPDFDKVASGVVVERIPPGPANPLGARWIGFTHGPGWTVGIHGTPTPHLLGRAVSSGCVRMRNADVIAIYERVRIGTPVRVEP